MTVSVIIPTYNRGHVILDAVHSVLAQTFDDFEVIVVDDGSDDDTSVRVRSIEDRRVTLVCGAHAGVSAARNTGIAAARGELISFLDSDDLWLPEKLEREVAFLDSHPDVDAVFSDAEKLHGGRFTPSFVEETAVFSRRFASSAPSDGVSLPQREFFLCLLEEVPIATIAFTVRRDVLGHAGPFDRSWSSFEDWEFYLRLAKRSRFGYLPQVLAVIFVSGDSLHLTDAAGGRSSMLDVLAREYRQGAGDAAVPAAAARGIARLTTRLAWHYEAVGRRRAAVGAYLRGFGMTGDPALLCRAGVVLLPARARSRLRQMMTSRAV